MNKAWSELHNNYKKRDWINKPSIFAEQAIKYFPSSGKVLELGAGLGQDSVILPRRVLRLQPQI